MSVTPEQRALEADATVTDLAHRIEGLDKRIVMLEFALQFYANADNWRIRIDGHAQIDSDTRWSPAESDKGSIARAVLDAKASS
jgi:hypothetical protein